VNAVAKVSRARVRCARTKFMELAPALTSRGASRTVKEKYLGPVFKVSWDKRVKSIQGLYSDSSWDMRVKLRL